MDSVCEPRLLLTLRAHRGEVTCADVAGPRLVTGGGDRVLRLWRWQAASGWDEQARVDSAHRYGVTSTRWAPGAVLLASAGVDGAVRVWCGRTLGARRALAAPRAPAVRALCWAGRARLLAGHDDGALCLWLVPRAVLLARLLAHEGALHAVTVLLRGALLLTACTDGVLKVFDLAEVCRSGEEGGEGGLVSVVPLTWVDGAHDMGALCADAAERGDLAATGGHDATVCVWHLASDGRGVALHVALAGHSAAVTSLRWGSRGALLVSASLDRTSRVWALTPEPRCVHVVHAHSRYLTCVTLAHDLSYMITGSNDKSIKMWSLGSLSLEDELEPPCVALEHFALGDLEGIEVVQSAVDNSEGADRSEEAASLLRGDLGEGCGARRAWLHTYQGPVNCVATYGDWIATASSDGWVRVYQWCEESGAAEERYELSAHQYPAMSVHFGAEGALLISAGLDARACLWDVQTGVLLRVLSVEAGGEVGGGGVREARLSPHRPPQILLATDDGIAPLWSIDSADTRPTHVFAGDSEGVTCCAWSSDGRIVATCAASGDLRLHATHPPRTAHLYHEPCAHEHGIQSCDFAPSCVDLELPENIYLLATGGCDSLLKLWTVETQQEEEVVCGARVRMVREVEAHGGGVASVRWCHAAGAEGAGGGGLLATSGADGWARVWRVARRGFEARVVGAVRGAGAGGVLAVSLLVRSRPALPLLLVCGTLAGELALYHLSLEDLYEDQYDGASTPTLWNTAAVIRWITDNVTRAPGARVSHEQEAALIRSIHDNDITGNRLVNDPPDKLLEDFGYDTDADDACNERLDKDEERATTRARLIEEITWLRYNPTDALGLSDAAPHSLLCPLSHRLLCEPARAADGYTYERDNILDWFLAAEGPVSPVSSMRLRNARVFTNYALRDKLRQFLRDNEQAPHN